MSRRLKLLIDIAILNVLLDDLSYISLVVFSLKQVVYSYNL